MGGTFKHFQGLVFKQLRAFHETVGAPCPGSRIRDVLSGSLIDEALAALNISPGRSSSKKLLELLRVKTWTHDGQPWYSAPEYNFGDPSDWWVRVKALGRQANLAGSTSDYASTPASSSSSSSSSVNASDSGSYSSSGSGGASMSPSSSVTTSHSSSSSSSSSSSLNAKRSESMSKPSMSKPSKSRIDSRDFQWDTSNLGNILGGRGSTLPRFLRSLGLTVRDAPPSNYVFDPKRDGVYLVVKFNDAMVYTSKCTIGRDPDEIPLPSEVPGKYALKFRILCEDANAVVRASCARHSQVVSAGNFSSEGKVIVDRFRNLVGDKSEHYKAKDALIALGICVMYDGKNQVHYISNRNIFQFLSSTELGFVVTRARNGDNIPRPSGQFLKHNPRFVEHPVVLYPIAKVRGIQRTGPGPESNWVEMADNLRRGVLRKLFKSNLLAGGRPVTLAKSRFISPAAEKGFASLFGTNTLNLVDIAEFMAFEWGVYVVQKDRELAFEVPAGYHTGARPYISTDGQDAPFFGDAWKASRVAQKKNADGKNRKNKDKKSVTNNDSSDSKVDNRLAAAKKSGPSTPSAIDFAIVKQISNSIQHGKVDAAIEAFALHKPTGINKKANLAVAGCLNALLSFLLDNKEFKAAMDVLAELDALDCKPNPAQVDKFIIRAQEEEEHEFCITAFLFAREYDIRLSGRAHNSVIVSSSLLNNIQMIVYALQNAEKQGIGFDPNPFVPVIVMLGRVNALDKMVFIEEALRKKGKKLPIMGYNVIISAAAVEKNRIVGEKMIKHMTRYDKMTRVYAKRFHPRLEIPE